MVLFVVSPLSESIRARLLKYRNKLLALYGFKNIKC
jgi:hypothetical protein